MGLTRLRDRPSRVTVCAGALELCVVQRLPYLRLHEHRVRRKLPSHPAVYLTLPSRLIVEGPAMPPRSHNPFVKRWSVDYCHRYRLLLRNHETARLEKAIPCVKDRCDAAAIRRKHAMDFADDYIHFLGQRSFG